MAFIQGFWETFHGFIQLLYQGRNSFLEPGTWKALGNVCGVLAGWATIIGLVLIPVVLISSWFDTTFINPKEVKGENGRRNNKTKG